MIALKRDQRTEGRETGKAQLRQDLVAMRSRSPLWCIQPCHRTTAATMWRSSYSTLPPASTHLRQRTARSCRENASTAVVLCWSQNTLRVL